MTAAAGMRRFLAILTLALAGPGAAGGGAAVPHGGTLRVAIFATPASPPHAPLGSASDLDPQSNDGGDAAELLRCCLVRTLTSYAGLPADQGGAELRPDLAA